MTREEKQQALQNAQAAFDAVIANRDAEIQKAKALFEGVIEKIFVNYDPQIQGVKNQLDELAKQIIPTE